MLNFIRDNFLPSVVFVYRLVFTEKKTVTVVRIRSVFYF